MKRVIFALLLIIPLTSFAQLNQGYKGFVDAGYRLNTNEYEANAFEISSSHGYQINPHFFVGGGVAMYFTNEMRTETSDGILFEGRDSKVDIPVFANVKINFLKGTISPYIDGRAGTYINNNGGLYYSLALGVRFSTNGTQAINLSIGGSSSNLEVNKFDHFLNKYDLSYSTKPYNTTWYGYEFKIGYEF